MREELWGFGFFLVKGHIGSPFFLFQQGRVCFFILLLFNNSLKFWKISTKKEGKKS